MERKQRFYIIIKKYIEGTCSPEELREAFSIFEKPYRNLWLRSTLYEFWNKQNVDIVDINQKEDFSALLDKIHHQINIKKNKSFSITKRIITSTLKIAALLLIGFITGMLINNIKIKEVNYLTSIAPNGSVSQMILPDSSLVYLNSGSELKYSVSNDNGEREVYLDGEAWFDIVRNENKPFIVHTEIYDVKVLGTQFNVKAYKSDNEFVTTLERGRVEIMANSEFNILSKSILSPGEQFIYNLKNKVYNVKVVSTKMYTSWKDNKLIFINMNLKQLIVLLERKYGVDIEVVDNIVLNYHYDGTIKDETILDVLDLLKETLPIQYKIVGQKVIIQKK